MAKTKTSRLDVVQEKLATKPCDSRTALIRMLPLLDDFPRHLLRDWSDQENKSLSDDAIDEIRHRCARVAERIRQGEFETREEAVDTVPEYTLCLASIAYQKTFGKRFSRKRDEPMMTLG